MVFLFYVAFQIPLIRELLATNFAKSLFWTLTTTTVFFQCIFSFKILHFSQLKPLVPWWIFLWQLRLFLCLNVLLHLLYVAVLLKIVHRHSKCSSLAKMACRHSKCSSFAKNTHITVITILIPHKETLPFTLIL